MAEEQQTQQTEVPAKEQSAATTSAETIKTDTQSQELTIPKHRYDEVSKRLQELEKTNAKREQERQAEDEKRLTEQAEWQKLAETRKAKIDELTPKVELADKLSAMVLEQYTAEIKEWPEQVRAMAPADDADILAKLDWMKRAKPLAVELMADKEPTPGNPRRPQPVGPAGKGAQETKARAEHERWSRTQF